MEAVCSLRSFPNSGRIATVYKDSAKAGERRKVAVVIHDGLSPFEFGVACEVFGYDRSYLGVPWYDTCVVAPEPGPVKTQLGFAIEAPRGLDAVQAAHTVIVPPVGLAALGHPDGVAYADERLLGALQAAHARGARIASLCSGAFLLARAGLLDGRRATTHWTSAARLAKEFPTVSVDPKVLYIDEGDVLTSAGSAASLDLCLHIVRKDFGAEIANIVARNLVVQPHRDGGQAQFVDMPLPSCDGTDLLLATLRWAQEHLDENLSVQLLARRAAMSPRTFARRFRAATGTTPHRWLLRQRVHLAQRLLETTDFTVDHVASLCGMGTASNLRLHFDAELGVAPGAYRRTFAQVVRLP
jgi:transcriptional regulator GlxA family with amidase domain